MMLLSSISGNGILAQSAQAAPTNSADVSAIASAYQVVSATATQLYAGTAYVTSVNGDQLSASRAGNAANASLANSAWYDGTGRLISALPDSAAVSAIASAYAESAASGKQDALTFGYDDGKISSIDGSSLAGQGGGEQVVTSLQYAVSEPTSKYELYQPAGTTGIDLTSNLLALKDTEYGMGQYNLSGLSSFDLFMSGGFDTTIFGQNGSASVSAMIVKASASGRQPWNWSTSDTAIGGTLASLQTGYDGGYNGTGSARVVTDGIQQYVDRWPDGTRFSVQPPLIFFTTAFYYGTARIGTAYGSASYVNTAIEGESSVSGVNELPLYVDNGDSVSAIAEAYAQSALSSVSSDYYPNTNPSGFVQSTVVVMRSSVGSSNNFITSINETPFMATDSAIAKRVSDTASVAYNSYQTAFVNFDADAVSRSVFVSLTGGPMTTYITARNSYGNNVQYGSITPTWNPSGNNYTGQYIVTSTDAVSAGINAGYYALSASAICGYTVPLAHASALPTYQYDAEDKISSINGSAIAGGGAAGVDSATCSAIASAYAESAASSKQDTLTFGYNTADQISSIDGSALGGMDEAAVSGIASAYAESAASSKADSTALTSYALSADVSGTVDLVSSQSANWGGSALALSAGPGVKLEKSGNVLVASTDETVLFSGSSYGVSFTETLSENITNFEYLGISISNAKNRASYTVYPVNEYPTNNMSVPTLFNKDVSYPKGIGLHGMTIVFNKTSADSITCGCWLFNFNDSVGNSDSIYLTKIVGINRTAEA